MDFKKVLVNLFLAMFLSLCLTVPAMAGDPEIEQLKADVKKLDGIWIFVAGLSFLIGSVTFILKKKSISEKGDKVWKKKNLWDGRNYI